VIVLYDARLPAAKRKLLSQWVNGGKRAVIAAPDARQSEPLRGVTAYRELSCSRFELAGLADFTEQWFDDLRAERVQ
jgi:hypothetical protein